MLALVTAAAAAAHDPDLAPLRTAFSDAGVDATIACWDDTTIDWSRFDAVIVRSTWDYVARLDEFRAWLESTAVVTEVVNSPDTIEWNLDKHYLRTLADCGVPIVPTTFVEVGDVPPELSGPGDVWVVKPAIGAGSNGARRCAPPDVAPHVAALHDAGFTAMVQPYLDLLDEHAETSLVFYGDGSGLTFDHAFSKQAILRSTAVEMDGDLFASEDIGARVPTAAEQKLARQVLASGPVAALGPLAYARVDVAPTADGPVLMELELVEPSIYVQTSEGSAGRAVRAWLGFLRTLGGKAS